MLRIATKTTTKASTTATATARTSCCRSLLTRNSFDKKNKSTKKLVVCVGIHHGSWKHETAATFSSLSSSLSSSSSSLDDGWRKHNIDEQLNNGDKHNHNKYKYKKLVNSNNNMTMTMMMSSSLPRFYHSMPTATTAAAAMTTTGMMQKRSIMTQCEKPPNDNAATEASAAASTSNPSFESSWKSLKNLFGGSGSSSETPPVATTTTTTPTTTTTTTDATNNQSMTDDTTIFTTTTADPTTTTTTGAAETAAASITPPPPPSTAESSSSIWKGVKNLFGGSSKPIPPKPPVTDTMATDDTTIFTTTTTTTTSSTNTTDPTPATTTTMTTTPLDSTLAETTSQAITTTVDAAAAGLPFEPNWYNIADQAINMVHWVQGTTGLEYGWSIVVLTIGVRVMMFPMFVISQRNTVRMSHMQPELAVLKEKMDKLGPANSMDHQVKMKVGLQMQALFAKYGVNPLKSVLPPLLQLPVFMGMFFGLRKMPDYFPHELSTGGMLWFPDLTASDPYYALPVVSAATFLCMTELMKDQMSQSNPDQGRMMTNLFRGLGVIMIPATAYFPAALFCYWCTNNSISLAQAMVFQNAACRKALGIWDPPKPVPGQEQGGGVPGIIDTLQEKIQQVTEGKPMSEEEKIRQHNESIERNKRAKKILKGRRVRRR